MKQIHEYEKDIASIRNIMERSVKFLSLSGLSGVLAGIYALIGATAAYFIIQYPRSPFEYRIFSVQEPDTLWKLILIAILVLVASLSTGVWLSGKKARKAGVKLWSPATKILFYNLGVATKILFYNLGVPLVTGGVFALIILGTGHFGLASPTLLIFYGLALIHGSSHTYDEIRYLGYSEIVLGLISALYPGFGLLFWTIGFGVLHIVYGTIMYNKYDK
jgi:hypothetical protein